jgi:chemotaxis family two-component system sensor kinase Cph1
VQGTATASLFRGCTDLDVVMQETLDALDTQVRTAGATIQIAPLPRVAGDSCALFRVFVNLLQNGLKYHQPDARPHVSVTAESEGTWAVISVSDNGIGIAPEERLRVFDRHYRTAAGVARADGEGLGLATVQRLVTGMGGTIWVDDAVERGTTIRFRLPLA